MKLVVSGCGSGGTNLGLELVRSLNSFEIPEGTAGKGSSEDREFFDKLFSGKLPERCATKLATESDAVTKEVLFKAFKNYADFRMVFMFRHPVDTCLSKVAGPWRAERPEGGLGPSSMTNLNKLGTQPSKEDIPDHTIHGAVLAVKDMYSIYFACKKEYSERLHKIKMEELILDRKKIRKELSAWLGVKYDNQDPEFWLTNEKQDHLDRYKGRLAPNVNLYRDLHNNYEGRFLPYQSAVSRVLDCFKKEMELFGYE